MIASLADWRVVSLNQNKDLKKKCDWSLVSNTRAYIGDEREDGSSEIARTVKDAL
jgi:hypothetical protein